MSNSGHEPTVKTISEYWSDDKLKVATVMRFETHYLVQMSSQQGRTEMVQFNTLQEAEDRAEDWVYSS
jgi:hypothetical protein